MLTTWHLLNVQKESLLASNCRSTQIKVPLAISKTRPDAPGLQSSRQCVLQSGALSIGTECNGGPAPVHSALDLISGGLTDKIPLVNERIVHTFSGNWLLNKNTKEYIMQKHVPLCDYLLLQNDSMDSLLSQVFLVTYSPSYRPYFLILYPASFLKQSPFVIGNPGCCLFLLKSQKQRNWRWTHGVRSWGCGKPAARSPPSVWIWGQ